MWINTEVNFLCKGGNNSNLTWTFFFSVKWDTNICTLRNFLDQSYFSVQFQLVKRCLAYFMKMFCSAVSSRFRGQMPKSSLHLSILESKIKLNAVACKLLGACIMWRSTQNSFFCAHSVDKANVYMKARLEKSWLRPDSSNAKKLTQM